MRNTVCRKEESLLRNVTYQRHSTLLLNVTYQRHSTLPPHTAYSYAQALNYSESNHNAPRGGREFRVSGFGARAEDLGLEVRMDSKDHHTTHRAMGRRLLSVSASLVVGLFRG